MTPISNPTKYRAGIDRAEQKRRELVEAQPAAKQSAKLLAALPKAAAEYRQQIAQGLQNDARAAGKARARLRKRFGKHSPRARGKRAMGEV